MQVDGAEVEDHQNVSPGPDTEVRISPLKVTLTPKRALSHLSQPLPLQLEVCRPPTYHPHTNTPLRSTEMESFVEQGSHASSPQLTVPKKTLVTRKARFKVGPSVLRQRNTLTFAERRSDAMVLIGFSGSVALGTSSGGNSERYSREGMADVVPSHSLIRNLLTLSLQTSLLHWKRAILTRCTRYA